MSFTQVEPTISGIDTSANSAAMIVHPFVLVDTNDTPLGTVANPLSVTTTSTSATLSSVASNTSSVSILSSNASRKTYSIYNDGNANMYIALASSSSLTAYTVKIPPNSFYESPINPCWQGVVSAIWDVVSGSARITEVI